ncbi:hypothetical protein HW555_008132 [Spodoptera exigua]|uniref:Uncharacterized protein n=1 Tax=Spodoptera exigua TaxID=7107 RepID=A0A835GER8_SPOEX|nr:hypothetical protein HW555_008132 [Spodoptera exigua]
MHPMCHRTVPTIADATACLPVQVPKGTDSLKMPKSKGILKELTRRKLKLYKRRPFALLLQSQLQNTPRKLTGQRWSVDDQNAKLDIIDGYQDHGNQGRTMEPATHALLFMAIGIRKKWK